MRHEQLGLVEDLLTRLDHNLVQVSDDYLDQLVQHLRLREELDQHPVDGEGTLVRDQAQTKSDDVADVHVDA